MYYLAQPPELRSFTKAAIYIVPYLLGVTSLVGIALLWITLAFVSFLYLVDLAYQFAGVRYGFSPEEFQLAKREMAYWPHAIAKFGSQIVQGTFHLAPFLALVILGRRLLAPLRFSAAVLLWVPLTTVGVGFASHQLGSIDLATYSAPSKMVVAAYEEWGAHFPWKSNYPEDQEVFEPSLSSSWGGMTEENREEVLNTYYNAVRWSVDSVLSSLLTDLDLDDQLVFYTSDHGQSILEGRPITHCTKDDPPSSQANVPLVLLGPVAEELFDGPVSVGAYSQFQLFPSTLAALGYSDAVVDEYGTPFWEEPALDRNPRYFYSGNLDRARRNAFDISRAPGAGGPEGGA